MGLAVFLVLPTLVAPVNAELTSGSDSCWLSHIELLIECNKLMDTRKRKDVRRRN